MRLVRLVLSVLLAASLPALAAAPAQAADDHVDIDVIQSLTGYGAFLGHNEHRSLELIEGVINAAGGVRGTRVRFVYHDDQSNPQNAVQIATEIIARKPAVILGSSLTATCSAIAPLLKQGPVLFCFSPAIHPAAGSYVFTSGVSTVDLSNALLRYARLRGWNRLGVMTSTDASGQDGLRALKANLALPENQALQLDSESSFAVTDLSVAAQLQLLKAANVQMFIPWSTGTPIGTVFRGLAQAGIDLPVGTTNGNMTYAQMTQYAEFLPHELYMPSAEWVVGQTHGIALPDAVAARQAEFYQAYAKAGGAPDEASMHPWDPALLVVQALRNLPAGASATQLRDALGAMKDVAGINGMYDFTATPQRGLSLANTVVTRWNAGARQWDVVSRLTGIPVAP